MTDRTPEEPLVAAGAAGPGAGLDPLLAATEVIEVTEAARGPEPGQPARVAPGFVVSYTIAYVGFWLAALAPIVVTLAIKVNALVGERGQADALGLVLGVGAVGSLLAVPVWGRLSDRSTSRFGKRRPWLALGAVGCLAGTLVMALAPSVPVLLVGFLLSQALLNAAGAALVPILADRVPPGQRGAISGLLGICTPIAATGSSFVIQAVSPNLLLMFLLPAVIGAVFIAQFVLVLREGPAQVVTRPRLTAREVVATFVVDPRKHPNFAWAWWSRFLLFMAVATLSTYLPYFLMNRLHTSITGVPRQVFLTLLVLSVTSGLFSIVGGRVSDRLGRRRIFVALAAVILAAGFTTIAMGGNLTIVLIGVAVCGVGQGIYGAVDLALVTEVLPNRAEVAKDMGVFSIASVLPQSIAPAVVPLLLAVNGGSYVGVYLAAGVAGLLSAVLILGARTVR